MVASALPPFVAASQHGAGYGLRLLPLFLGMLRDVSLLRWLALAENRPFLLDWGPHEPKRGLGRDDHVTRVLLPLIAGFREPPVLVGYRLGGALALAVGHVGMIVGSGVCVQRWEALSAWLPALPMIA